MKHKVRLVLSIGALLLVQYLLLFQQGLFKLLGAAALLIPLGFLLWKEGGRILHDGDFRKEVLLTFSSLLCLFHGLTNLLGAATRHSISLVLLGGYFLVLLAAKMSLFRAFRHKDKEAVCLKVCGILLGLSSLLFLALDVFAVQDLEHLVKPGGLRDVTLLYMVYEVTFGLAFLWENKKHRRRLYVACGFLSLSTVLVTGFSLASMSFHWESRLWGLGIFGLLVVMAAMLFQLSGSKPAS